jgi:hypothetical protein
MTTNIATLRAPSDSLLSLVFPSPRRIRELRKKTANQQNFWRFLLEDPLIEKEVERLAKVLIELARPLAQAQDLVQLEQKLVEQMPSYLLWKGEFYAVVLNRLNRIAPDVFLDSYTDAGRQIQSLVQSQASLHLSDEDTESLKLALYGACMYSENFLSILFSDGPQAVDPAVLGETIEYFIKADYLILTSVLMLNRDIQNEHKQVLSLIAQQAEALVKQIEDKLMSHNVELRQRLEKPVESTASLKVYRQRRGLE